MSRAVVVGTSATTAPAVSRSRRKPATTGANAIASSSEARPRPPAASKRKAPSSTTGSTSGAGAGTSTAPPKRARKTSIPAAANPSSTPVAKAAKKSRGESSSRTKKEAPEKRLARYIAAPSTATSERITRAFQHRLYLIDKKLVGDLPNSPTACHFNVLGSTGNVYEVKLQQRPSCTCPDFPRSGLCKHILFVMLRVLKLDRNDPRVWQKALLNSELSDLLDISAVSDGVLASQSVRQRFQELQRSSGKLEEEEKSTAAAAPAKTVQREITGDCPICYERMDDDKGKAKEAVVFCRVCGNNVHRDCFDRWSRSKSSSGGETTCIYCRAVWAADSDATKKGKASSDYMNLADGSELYEHSSLEDLYPESHRWIHFHGRRGRGRGSGRGRGRGR